MIQPKPMSNDYSDEAIRKKCPHCDPNSFALFRILKETDKFRIVCDVHPLTEGHILVMPKKHISCIGAYPDEYLREFLVHHSKVSSFVLKTYRALAVFEHGIAGQSVYHSHIHYLPYTRDELKIIPEGKKYLTSINSLEELKKLYQDAGAYLYFALGNRQWSVDLSIGVPRFFRDRFATALGNGERGDWKKMSTNKKLMEKAVGEIANLRVKWFSKG